MTQVEIKFPKFPNIYWDKKYFYDLFYYFNLSLFFTYNITDDLSKFKNKSIMYAI